MDNLPVLWLETPSLPLLFTVKTAASSVESVTSELPTGLQEFVTTTQATSRSAKIPTTSYFKTYCASDIWIITVNGKDSKDSILLSHGLFSIVECHLVKQTHQQLFKD